MRVICPKCAASYEIPVRAIPLDGREVQCSACAHAWYQLPPPAPAPMSLSPEASAAAEIADESQEADAPLERLRRAIHPAAVEEDDTFGATPRPRRKIDPEVLKVLRDEASFEASARRKTTSVALETQPDLGLPAPVRQKAGDTVRQRLARLQAAETKAKVQTWQPGEESLAAGPPTELPPPDTAETPAARSETSPPDLTPSASSHLTKRSPAPKRPAADAAAAPVTYGLPVALSRKDLAIIAERRERRGFRWGFGLTAGACTAAVALYLLAPTFGEVLPAGGPLIDAIVSGGETVQNAVADALRGLLGRADPAIPG